MTSDMRILVVEDDNKIASFVVKGLKQAGFAVDRCADGEEALAFAETTAYDAAIVDIMLPKARRPEHGAAFAQPQGPHPRSFFSAPRRRWTTGSKVCKPAGTII
jgi:CheY-like chemotaxis protein